MLQQNPSRNGRIADSSLPALVRFPGEDGGRSLAEMAQRDLDAALQLLADRAQYITGASGAAIALQRDGMKHMVCRASAGENAPELGALLSTEVGLSGESVRTRQLLHCDDAEQDARVNQEVCRQLGIASVLVMPVLRDDHVLGVFELFSGKANAFGDRDLSALRRLSEMVETAVRLAQAAEFSPDNVRLAEAPDTELAGVLTAEATLDNAIVHPEVEPAAPLLTSGAGGGEPSEQKGPPVESDASASAALVPEGPVQIVPAATQPTGSVDITSELEDSSPRKKLFWSSTLNPAADAARPAPPEQKHVPPVLRGLRKCDSCGFPVSEGRVLCVECEEKKWRGQLKRQPAVFEQTAPAIPLQKDQSPVQVQAAGVSVTTLTAVQGAATAAAPAFEKLAKGSESAPGAGWARTQKPDAELDGELRAASAPVLLATERKSDSSEPAATLRDTPSPNLDLSGGLEVSPSWFSTNKYVIAVLLVVAAVIVGILIFR